jgi:hypothetical protein
MATANQVISAALSKIGAKTAGVAITPNEESDGIFILNNTMEELESAGYELGWTTIALGADTVTVADGEINFVITQLVGRLWPEYEDNTKPIPLTLVADIDSAQKNVISSLNSKSVGLTNTAQDFIYSAILRSNPKENPRPISTIEITNGIPKINDLMFQLEADGYEFSFVALTLLTDFPVIPDYAREFVKLELALRLAREDGGQPDQVIVENAGKARKSVINKLNNLTVTTTGDTQDFIYSAIVRVYSQGNERPITANEIASAIPKFNDLMLELDADGFEFSFVPVTLLADVPVIPTYAHDFVKLELSLRLARELGSQPDQVIAENAGKARKAVINKINNLAVGLTGTAQDFIYSAINRIYAQANERPLSTIEITNGIPKLNDIIFELEAEGFEFSLSAITLLTDIPVIPDYAVNLFKTELYLKLAREYGSTPDEVMVTNNQKAREAVTRELNDRIVSTANTVQDIVFNAIERVKMQSKPVTTNDQNNAISVLNDLMFELTGEGFEFGYVAVSSLGDTPIIPNNAMNWIKSEMSLRLARQYNSQPDEIMIASVQGARAAVVEEINRKATGDTGTAQNIIFSAIQLLTKVSKPITQTQIDNGLNVLNEFMTEQAEAGLSVGYRIVDSLTDAHHIPDFMNNWVKCNIAIRMAANLNATVNQELASAIAESEKAVYSKLVKKPRVKLPTRLPLGGRRRFRNQFPIDSDRNAILTENCSYLTLEDGKVIGIDENE